MKMKGQSSVILRICLLLALIFFIPFIKADMAWGQSNQFVPMPPSNDEKKNNAPFNSINPPVSTTSEQSNNIRIDSSGHKTIVIHDDISTKKTTKPKITKKSSPNIIIDEHGHKTIVIHDDNEKQKTKHRKLTDIPTNNIKTKEKTQNQHPYWKYENNDNETQPYWEMPKRFKNDAYYLKSKSEDDSPYWLKKEDSVPPPYWQKEDKKNEAPYWLDPEPDPEEESIEEEEQASTSVQASLPSNTKTISYFMFTDKQGITHLADIPTDSRYRKITISIDVKVTRGMGRLGSKFTHESLRPYIMRASVLYNLDPALIAAVIKSESAFDSKAVSWAGAQGLMQLMPATAREVGCLDPFDPEQNIMGGSRYLRKMLNTFNGDLTLAVAAYNAGPERVKKVWRVPNIKETQNYVIIVFRNYEKYKSDY